MEVILFIMTHVWMENWHLVFNTSKKHTIYMPINTLKSNWDAMEESEKIRCGLDDETNSISEVSKLKFACPPMWESGSGRNTKRRHYPRDYAKTMNKEIHGSHRLVKKIFITTMTMSGIRMTLTKSWDWAPKSWDGPSNESQLLSQSELGPKKGTSPSSKRGATLGWLGQPSPNE